MRIRSITIGAQLGYPVGPSGFQALGQFQERARRRFADRGMEVQTVRLATQPFPEVLGEEGPSGAAPFGQALEAACQGHGIDYCSVGAVLAAQRDAELGYLDAIPEILARTGMVFASVLVADRDSGINLSAVRRAADIIFQISGLEPSGFGNLRFAVLANCGPGSPFFPGSFHSGEGTAFAIATEAADLAVEAYSRAQTLEEARLGLRDAVKERAGVIEEVARGLEAEFGLRFAGIDFSLAPYPEYARSLGYALEQLGVDAFGGNATLFAAALTTRALREASYPRCGFSGLFFPVLEDRTLAQRSAEGLFSVDSLLLYSTVCGTGLDTVPLPGDVGTEELAAILLDVATLALVADKPLTARLMPIPGARAGEMTDFDFPYFSNARILDVRGRGAASVFERNDSVYLGSRVRRPGWQRD
jgi:uncharacterized protein (UPF0210 family)